MKRTRLIFYTHPYNVSVPYAKIACKLLTKREHGTQKFWFTTGKNGFRRFYTKCTDLEFKKFRFEYIEYILGVRDALRFRRRSR